MGGNRMKSGREDGGGRGVTDNNNIDIDNNNSCRGC